MSNTKEKKKMGLTTKIFISLLAGALFGVILCYLVPKSSIKDDVIVEGILYVIGQGFIRLMKMLVVPLVFCSIVCGSMSIGDTKNSEQSACVHSFFICLQQPLQLQLRYLSVI